MMKVNWQNFKLEDFARQSFWALLSGVLVGTTYIPFPPWALLFCWTPLWWDILRKPISLRLAFQKAWLAQFVLSLIGFHWISFVSHEFGNLPWPIAGLVLLLFASLVHLYFPLTVVFALWCQRRLKLPTWGVAILIPLFTALGEIGWPALFPWNLGYTLLWAGSPIAQWADVIGFQGLSAGLLLINGVLTIMALHRRPIVWWPLGAGLLTILACLTWGGLDRQKPWQNSQGAQTQILRVLPVQANIGNFEKFMALNGQNFRKMIVDQYLNLTRQSLATQGPVDLILWPESALPLYMDRMDLGETLAQQIGQFVTAVKVPLLTGAFSHQLVPQKGQLANWDYNALFLFDENMQLLGSPYRKTQLLAFGEYIPGEEVFPILSNLNLNGGGFHRGEGPTTLKFRETSLGPMICYESLDPQFSRRLSLLGAEVLINITNDSWFGPISEPPQHLFMTLARALEVRRPLIRVTNTGITTAILADGTLLAQSPVGSPWSNRLDIDYRPSPPQTFYAQYGQYLAAGLVFISLLWIALVKTVAAQNRELP